MVNGSFGVVEDIIYHRDKNPQVDVPAVVMVRFENYTGPTMHDGTVPIAPIVKGWDDARGNHLTRAQFSLALAYASTVH